MLTTLSILSRSQGNLTARNETEAEYFARFAPKAATLNGLLIFHIVRWLPLTWRKVELAK